MTVDEKIIDLETKFAFQEDLLKQLNDVIIEQADEIKKLQTDLNRLQQYVESGGDSGIKDAKDEKPPPHY